MAPEQAGRAGGGGRCRVLWKVCSAFLDAFTVGVSVVDIVTDALVLRDFARMGHTWFFAGSAAIFALAQLSYAFLFTATFAAHRRPRVRCVVFLLVLPFAQLVPLFTWLQAFRFREVDQWLNRLGLRAGADPAAGAACDAGDSLWSFLQSKYQSHAGFLVEAFVEAVPQAVLQTVFVVTAPSSTSALSAASVAISVFTVASKGYLVSFALDRATFAFNFGCIVADCLGLFAIATTLALHGPRGAADLALAALALSGLVLSVIAGHGVVWFTILDDHLKLRDRPRWPAGVRRVSNVFFDLYVVRLVAWFLAIVPCAVLFAGARLALVPVLALRSIDPDLVRYACFFRALERFLAGAGGGSADRSARLWTLNTFIARARRSTTRLERALRFSRADCRAAVVSQWAAQVGAPQAGNTRLSAVACLEPPQGGAMEEDAMLQQAILDSFRSLGGQHSSAGFVGVATSAFRRLRAVAWLHRHLALARRELESRSEVFRWCLAARHHSEWWKSPTDAVLRGCAVASVAVVLLCAAPLLLGHGLLLVAGIAFPFLHLHPTCAAVSSGEGTCSAAAAEDATDAAINATAKAALPCGLTAAYCATLVCLVALAPTVVRRQLIWLDLLDLRGFPDAFYGGAVLGEVRKRHLRNSILQLRLGHFLLQHVLTFLEE